MDAEVVPMRQKRLKLSKIDPKKVARNAVVSLLEFAELNEFALSEASTFVRVVGDNPDDELREASLYCDVLNLGVYAQTGVWPEDEGTVREAIQSVVQALFTLPDGRSFSPLNDPEEPIRELDLVVVAAGSRSKLEGEYRWGVFDMAVLAGMTTEQVRHLVTTGEIPSKGHYLEPAHWWVERHVAMQWLKDRGVKGIVVPPPKKYAVEPK